MQVQQKVQSIMLTKSILIIKIMLSLENSLYGIVLVNAALNTCCTLEISKNKNDLVGDASIEL